MTGNNIEKDGIPFYYVGSQGTGKSIITKIILDKLSIKKPRKYVYVEEL